MPSLNESLRDSVLQHMIYLERLKNSQTKEIVDFIDTNILADLIDQLRIRYAKIENLGYDTGAATTKRIEDMIASFEAITDRFMDAHKNFKGTILDIGAHEADWQIRVLNDNTPKQIDFILPTAAKINRVLTDSPFDGRTLEGWFENLAKTTQERLAVTIRQGIVEGQTVDQIVRRVQGTRATRYTDGILNTTRAQTRAVVHSAIQHASNAARQDVFTENADYLKGVQWVSTLDSHTCLVCAPLDGKLFPVNEGVRPPKHPNCRCTIVPVTKSFKELGLDIEEIEPQFRASMNGQVPAKTTYAEWLKSQPKDFQIEALGPTRAKLFRDGTISISQFTNSTGHVLTLDQLKTIH